MKLEGSNKVAICVMIVASAIMLNAQPGRESFMMLVWMIQTLGLGGQFQIDDNLFVAPKNYSEELTF